MGQRRRRIRSAFVLAIQLSSLVALTLWTVAAPASAIGPDAPLLPATTFQSQVRLRVAAILPASPFGFTDKSLVGEVIHLGFTPAPEPLAIPACTTWFVAPANPDIDNAGLARVVKEVVAKSVPGLSLRDCQQITDKGAVAFKSLGELDYLDLSGTRLSDKGFRRLTAASSLRTLLLERTEIKAFGPLVKKLRKLETLDVSQCVLVTDVETGVIAKFSGLRRLRMESLIWLTDRGLEHLEKAKRLEWLDVSGNQRLTDESLQSIGKMKSLRGVRTNGSAYTAEGFAGVHPKCRCSRGLPGPSCSPPVEAIERAVEARDAQFQHIREALRLPPHPGPLEARLHEVLAGAFHGSRPDREAREPGVLVEDAWGVVLDVAQQIVERLLLRGATSAHAA